MVNAMLQSNITVPKSELKKLPPALLSRRFKRAPSDGLNELILLDKLEARITHKLNLLDQKTKAHCERVSALTEKFAQFISTSQNTYPSAYKLSSSGIRCLKLAARYHDLGKIRLPHEIIFKKGLLTEDEVKLIKLHSLHSVQEIQHTAEQFIDNQIYNFYLDLLSAVLASHEHIDGSGYPLGLKRDDISIGGRIIAVVDAFDSMVNPHVPRDKIRTVDEAISELKRCSNTQFDSIAVSAFCAFISSPR
ncbi:MAG: HD domain-containing phosphohydrolase [Candidatus Micrarchaeota archaeon]